MTVAELIIELQKMPQDFKVTVFYWGATENCTSDQIKVVLENDSVEIESGN